MTEDVPQEHHCLSFSAPLSVNATLIILPFFPLEASLASVGYH